MGHYHRQVDNGGFYAGHFLSDMSNLTTLIASDDYSIVNEGPLLPERKEFSACRPDKMDCPLILPVQHCLGFLSKILIKKFYLG